MLMTLLNRYFKKSLLNFEERIEIILRSYFHFHFCLEKAFNHVGFGLKQK